MDGERDTSNDGQMKYLIKKAFHAYIKITTHCGDPKCTSCQENTNRIITEFDKEIEL